MTAFEVIVIIMLCISNIQTFLILCCMSVLNVNTKWGRSVDIIAKGGMNNEESEEGRT